MTSKNSSRVAEFERRLAAAGGPYERAKVILTSNVKDVNASMENHQRRLRERLIVELANLRDDGLSRFRKNIAAQFHPEPDGLLFNARRDLRYTWLLSTPGREKQQIVDAWFSSAWIQLLRLKTHFARPVLAVGQIVVDPMNFRAQFAIAIMENWRKFAVCSNPKCPAPYFLFKRRTQRICERGECTAFVQRKFALAWWDKEGSRRRAVKRNNLRKSRKKGRAHNPERKGK